MNTVAKDIADLLVSNGFGSLGTSSGWSIFVGLHLETPNQIISCHNVSQTRVKFYDREAEAFLFEEVFSILVRGNPEDYENTAAKAQQIKNYLEGLTRFEVEEEDASENVTYANVICPSMVYLGFDNRRRQSWSLEGEASRLLSIYA